MRRIVRAESADEAYLIATQVHGMFAPEVVEQDDGSYMLIEEDF